MSRALCIASLAVCALGTACTSILGVTDVPTPADAGTRPDAGSDGSDAADRCTGCKGKCALGRCLLTLATNQGSPSSIAVDSAAVFWTTDESIMREDIGGGPRSTLVGGQAFPIGLVLGCPDVLWANAEGNSIQAYSFRSDATTSLAMNQDNPQGVATDEENVYFTTTSTVSLVPIGGGTVRVLAGGQNGPVSVAVDANHVYWSNIGSGNNGSVVESAKTPTDAGALVILAANQASPQGVALDATHVYWANAGSNSNNDGTIMRVRIGGGTPETIAAGQASPLMVAVDGENAYWANNADGTVRRAPASGGADQILVSGQMAPDAIAVDPSNVYWTTDVGTVMQTTKD